MLNFDTAQFRYEPYPIGRATPVFEEGLYNRLVDAFPPKEMFNFYNRKGQRSYYMNEFKTPDRYEAFVKSSPVWRELHEWVKSPEFMDRVFSMLAANQINLNHLRSKPSPMIQARKVLSAIKRGRIPTIQGTLYTRFEFAMLGADGGSTAPHTDAPEKAVTIVVSMVKPGEWDTKMGGGLEVSKPKDITKNFGQVNPKMGFDEFDPVTTYEFLPNQAVIFVKTFNSWHTVRPLVGPADKFRRTICINILTE